MASLGWYSDGCLFAKWNLELLVAVGTDILLPVGHGFIFPNTSALALSPFKALAGSASALLGCIQMGLGALASAAVSYLHDNTAMPMLAVMCTCAALSLVLHLAVSRLVSPH